MALYASALVILGFAAFVRFRDWNLEDGYIVFRMVRNILHHGEWAFNVGELHNASTSVLNTVLLALGASTGIEIPIVAHLLGAAYLSGTALLLFFAFRSRIGPLAAAALGAGVIFFLSHYHTWGFGLETFLVVMLLSLSVALDDRPLLRWICIGLLILARPDAVLFALIYFFLDVRRQGWRALFTPLAGVLVCVPWILFSLLTFSQLFPDTLSNKMWQGRSGFWGTGWIYARGLGEHLLSWRSGMPVIAVSGLCGMAWLAAERSKWVLIPIFALLLQLAYSLLNVPAYLWYFSTLDFALLLGAGYFIGRLFHLVALKLCTPRHLFTLQWCGAVAALVWSAVELRGSIRNPHSDSGNRHYLAAADFIRRQPLPDGALAAAEVGTLGYALERPILDIIGLTSPNPEYLTGKHLDHFFQAPPALVLLHEPTWTMEAALATDVRFLVLYGSGVNVPSPHTPLRLFVRSSEAQATSKENVRAYIEGHYQPYRAWSVARGGRASEFECHVDLINGSLVEQARQRRFEPMRLIVSGWIRSKDGSALATPEALHLVLRGATNSFALPVTPTAREDVARHFKVASESVRGFSSAGHTLAMPPGGYQIELQGNGYGCATGTRVRTRPE